MFEWIQVKCTRNYSYIDTCWICITDSIFHLSQKLLIIFSDLFKIWLNFCCNVTVTCLLCPYPFHNDKNSDVTRSFLIQYLYIIDNIFSVITELFCKFIPQCTVHQRILSGQVLNLGLWLIPKMVISEWRNMNTCKLRIKV